MIYRCACLDWEYDEWKIIGGYNQLYWSLTVSLGNIWQEIGKVDEGRYYDDNNYFYARHMRSHLYHFLIDTYSLIATDKTFNLKFSGHNTRYAGMHSKHYSHVYNFISGFCQLRVT